ncbi:MAG: hypothetical protein QXD72_02555 [Candidatus Aenigmatarchaeota archaeon]
MKGAIPIPYVIALIFGVMLLALLGYWISYQSSKTIGTGQTTQCDTRQHLYCSQWKLSRFNVQPLVPLGNCERPDQERCKTILGCVCKSGDCEAGYENIGENIGTFCSGNQKLCCPV